MAKKQQNLAKNQEEKQVYGVKPEVTEIKSAKTEQYETIFTLVEHDGRVDIAVGRNIVSRKSSASVEEAKQYIDSKPWELIVNATCAIYDLSKNNNNN